MNLFIQIADLEGQGSLWLASSPFFTESEWFLGGF